MSWVSQANIKTIMTAIRNKFTTSDLVIANDAKDTGVELNYASQDGLVTVSPISTSASTEAALHLSNGDDTKKTELTQGTLSYVTGTGSSETYNYMSLLGDGVTFGKNGGGNVQVGGVADPTSAQQVATKNYVDKRVYTLTSTTELDAGVILDPGSRWNTEGVMLDPSIFKYPVLFIDAHLIETSEYAAKNVVAIPIYNKDTKGNIYIGFVLYNPLTETIRIPSGSKVSVWVHMLLG